MGYAKISKLSLSLINSLQYIIGNIKLKYFDKWNQSICLGGIKGVTKVPEMAIFCGLEPFLGGFRESMRLQWVIIKNS